MDQDMPTDTKEDNDQMTACQEDQALIRDLMDQVEGLQADLDSAIEVAVSRGAITWARMNYPGHHSLKGASIQMEVAAAAGLSVLWLLHSEHDMACKAIEAHLSAGQSNGLFDGMTSTEVRDLYDFHNRSKVHLADEIQGFLPETQKLIEQKRIDTLRKVAEAEREACLTAVGKTWAPVTGTPYITGSRKFCQAIRQLPTVDETSVFIASE